MDTLKVSVIVPAHNEAPRIGAVLDALAGHPLIAEVIVVDDGSTDATADVLRARTDIQPIILEHNVGKSKAVVRGIREASQELIMLIDADLSNLKHEDLTRLIEPVSSGSVDMTISMRSSVLWPYRLFGLDFVSGERVFRKSFVPDYSAIERLKGYELEVYLNNLVVQRRNHIRVVYWANVTSPMKSQKSGFSGGWFADVRMTWDIIRYMTLWGALKQYFTLRSLRR